jgi:hypothetical protein
MERTRTVTVEAVGLIDALDSLADGHGPLDDPDQLIGILRGIIASFAFDLDAAAHFP